MKPTKLHEKPEIDYSRLNNFKKVSKNYVIFIIPFRCVVTKFSVELCSWRQMVTNSSR